MPYQRRFIQKPFQPAAYAAYIQRGGGFFSSMLDGMRNTFMPWAVQFGKTLTSSLSNAAKSKAAQRIVKNAKNTVEKHLYNAGSRILKGDNVGRVIKESADQTKSGLADVIKKEANKQGDILQKKAVAVGNTTAKPKKPPKALTKRKYPTSKVILKAKKPKQTLI